MLERAIQSYLSECTVAAGETVQCGWLVFRVVDVGPPVTLESLDFKRVASFTRDLSRAEGIYREQQEMLKRHGVEEELWGRENDSFLADARRYDCLSGGWNCRVLPAGVTSPDGYEQMHEPMNNNRI